MAWINFQKEKPCDADYALIKLDNGVIKLGIYMSDYRDNNGRFAAKVFFNEETGEIIKNVVEWHEIPS